MNKERQKRLRAIFPGPGRDQQELVLTCLKMGMEMERRFFGNRLRRRQAVIDHARAFMDFVNHNVIEDAEE